MTSFALLRAALFRATKSGEACLADKFLFRRGCSPYVTPVNLSVGQLVQLEIQDIAFGGEGVGRIEGFVVFVPFVLVGERVEPELTEVKKNFARARGFKPASRLQWWTQPDFDTLPVENRRYSRLETCCATTRHHRNSHDKV